MENRKLRILVVGDLVVPTGFSTVLHNITIPNLDEFDITGLGVNYKGDPHNLGFPVYPASTAQGNVYGIDRLCNMLNSTKFDMVFFINDAWVISYYLDAIKKNVKNDLPKIVVYFPVDSRFHNKSWYKDFDIVTKIFTYTKFGKEVARECLPDRDIEIMPHGTNFSTYYKAYETRAQAKIALLGEAAYKMGKPEDLFFVLNANRNQPRKRLDTTMAGFALFAKNKPKTVKLYMHCGARDAAIDIPYISVRYGIDDRLLLTSLVQGIQRVSEEKLNMIYNACDVGINTGMGEGWGLISTEHGITGAPQIVPDHSACRELFEDCGEIIKTSMDFTFDHSQTVGRLVSPEAVADSLEHLYQDKELREELSKKTLAKFLQPEYQWQSIAKRWAEIFKEVCK